MISGARQADSIPVRRTVADWAAARYSSGPISDPYPSHRPEKFGEEGLTPGITIRRGLPADFPRVETTPEAGWANRDTWYERAEAAYAAGYGDALVHAILNTKLYSPRLALPVWVTTALVHGFDLWVHRDAKNLEHALGIASSRFKLAEEQFWTENLGQIYFDIEDARSQGFSRYANNEELFRVIAAHYGKSKTSIKNRYNAFKWRLRPEKPESDELPTARESADDIVRS